MITPEQIQKALEEQRRGSIMPLPPDLTLHNPEYYLSRDDRIDFRGTRPASGLWNALKWLVGIRGQVVVREVTFCRYAIAEELLRNGTGWQLAPEEDTNHRFGWVWLERDAEEEKEHGRIA